MALEIPRGYSLLHVAFDRVGKWLYPGSWTGKELDAIETDHECNKEEKERRENVEKEFRQIMYGGHVSSGILKTLTGEKSNWEPTNWLASIHNISFNDSGFVPPDSPFLTDFLHDWKIIIDEKQLENYIKSHDGPENRMTSGAQTRCERWIRQRVESGYQPQNRKAMFHEAIVEISDLSRRGFDRAWAAEAPEDWKNPGRKPQK